MEYCFPVWGCGGSVALGMLDKIQSIAFGLISSPIITNQLPKLQFRRDDGSLPLFYWYFYGHARLNFQQLYPLLFFVAVPQGVRSRHIVTHLQFFLVAHLHIRDHFCLVQLCCGTHYHKDAFLTTSTFRILKRDPVISLFLWGFADSVQGAGSLAAPHISTCTLVKKTYLRNLR